MFWLLAGAVFFMCCAVVTLVYGMVREAFGGPDFFGGRLSSLMIAFLASTLPFIVLLMLCLLMRL